MLHKTTGHQTAEALKEPFAQVAKEKNENSCRFVMFAQITESYPCYMVLYSFTSKPIDPISHTFIIFVTAARLTPLLKHAASPTPLASKREIGRNFQPSIGRLPKSCSF